MTYGSFYILVENNTASRISYGSTSANSEYKLYEMIHKGL